jgi:hypothetical protein
MAFLLGPDVVSDSATRGRFGSSVRLALRSPDDDFRDGYSFDGYTATLRTAAYTIPPVFRSAQAFYDKVW